MVKGRVDLNDLMLFFFDEEDNVVIILGEFWLVVLFLEFNIGVRIYFGIESVCLLLLNFFDGC